MLLNTNFQFENMGGVKPFGSMGLLDAVAIAEGVEHFLKNNGNLELYVSTLYLQCCNGIYYRVEMVGSFPSDVQTEKHILEKDLPYFLPTDYDQLNFTNPENYVEYKMYGNYLEGIT